MATEHWEQDQWDDHPAGASAQSSMGAGIANLKLIGMQGANMAPVQAAGYAAAAGSNPGMSDAKIQAAMAHAKQLAASGVDPATAAKQAIAAQQGFFAKLMHFIAHPIQTTRAAIHQQSGMHGAPVGRPLPLSTDNNKPSWWEHQNGLSPWDESR